MIYLLSNPGRPKKRVVRKASPVKRKVSKSPAPRKKRVVRRRKNGYEGISMGGGFTPGTAGLSPEGKSAFAVTDKPKKGRRRSYRPTKLGAKGAKLKRVGGVNAPIRKKRKTRKSTALVKKGSKSVAKRRRKVTKRKSTKRKDPRRVKAGKKAARTRKRLKSVRATARKRRKPSRKARRMATRRRARRPAAYRKYKTWGRKHHPRKIRKLKRGRKTRGAWRGHHAVRRAHRTLWRAKTRGPKASRRYMAKNRIRVGRRPNFIGGIIQGVKAALPAAVSFVGAKLVGGFTSGLAANTSSAMLKKAVRPATSAALLIVLSTLGKRGKLPGFVAKYHGSIQVGLGVALIHDVASMLLGTSPIGASLGMASTGEYVTSGDYIDTGAYIDTGDYVDVGDVAELDAGQGNIPRLGGTRLLPGTAAAHAQVNRWAPTQEDDLYHGVFGGNQRLGVGQ